MLKKPKNYLSKLQPDGGMGCSILGHKKGATTRLKLTTKKKTTHSKFNRKMYRLRFNKAMYTSTTENERKIPIQIE